jgi:hypothetical protein
MTRSSPAQRGGPSNARRTPDQGTSCVRACYFSAKGTEKAAHHSCTGQRCHGLPTERSVDEWLAVPLLAPVRRRAAGFKETAHKSVPGPHDRQDDRTLRVSDPSWLRGDVPKVEGRLGR